MTAYVFVPLLAFAWMIGTAVESLAAAFFLAVLESSGNPTARPVNWRGPSFRSWMRDGIEWPEGTIGDHLGKGLYLGYIVLLWGAPAILLGRLVGGPTVWATVVAGAAFWLLLPIGLLSSMSSVSRWTPFRPGLLVAYGRRPLATLSFYVLSAPVLAALVFCFELVLIHPTRMTVGGTLALAPVGVLVFFLYARLLGRFGLVLSYAFPEEPMEDEEEEARTKRRRRKKRRRPINAYDPRTRMFSPTEEIPDEPPLGSQPPEMQGIETPYDGVVTGYGVDYSGDPAPVEEPKPAPVIHTFDDEDDEPIIVAPPPEISTDRQRIAETLAASTERELTLHAPSRIPEPDPARAYGVDTVAFLFDVNTIGPWVALTAGVMLMSVIQRGLDLLRPE
jgi:hypothetical protein